MGLWFDSGPRYATDNGSRGATARVNVPEALKPQNDTQLIYLLTTTILGNLATVEVSSS